MLNYREMLKTRDYFFIGCDGALHDTRMEGWSAHPVRPRYAWSHAEIKTAAQFKATLRAGAYAWPGGYPLYLLTNDGAARCFACAHKEARQVFWDFQNKASTGWRVVACGVNYEDNDLYCDHCNKQIESAYSAD